MIVDPDRPEQTITGRRLTGIRLDGIQIAVWPGGDRHPTTLNDVDSHPGLVQWWTLTGVATVTDDTVTVNAVNGQTVDIEPGYRVVARNLPPAMDVRTYQSPGVYGWQRRDQQHQRTGATW